MIHREKDVEILIFNFLFVLRKRGIDITNLSRLIRN